MVTVNSYEALERRLRGIIRDIFINDPVFFLSVPRYVKLKIFMHHRPTYWGRIYAPEGGVQYPMRNIFTASSITTAINTDVARYIQTLTDYWWITCRG